MCGGTRLDSSRIERNIPLTLLVGSADFSCIPCCLIREVAGVAVVRSGLIVCKKGGSRVIPPVGWCDSPLLDNYNVK